MGFWFNNFLEFERKQKRPNRLILNFYYAPDPDEDPRSVKIFVEQEIKIPTNFLMPDKMKKLEEKLSMDPTLNQFEFKQRKVGRFMVGELPIPYDQEIIKLLPSEFQKGNYDKLLKFDGFYPERKVELSPELEERFRSEDEIELKNLEGIIFGDFMNVGEIESLPYLVIDIEKPLFKTEDEKKLLAERENLLKVEKKYEKLEERDVQDIKEHREGQWRIGHLEKKLTYNHYEDVGEIPIYEEKFDSKISFITTIWSQDGQEIKEAYVIDSNQEFGDEEFSEFEGYNVIRFENESDLVGHLTANYHRRKPVISYGQNQVYDITQIRFASENHKQIFDPAVKDVKPGRDFVRKFLQRLREDMIYFDTLWMNSIFRPYLRQRSFGTSLKLEAIAESYDIEFKKSQTHEGLRELGLKIIVGNTLEIRKQAMRDMLEYSIPDVDVTAEIIKKMDFLHVLSAVKEILPFSTFSEIAFSTNCMNKLHDYRTFSKSRNLPYSGYKQKEREDQLQIFKKRFPSGKRKALKRALENFGVRREPKGEYENVTQFYLPLEMWTKDIAFRLWPAFEEAEKNIGDDKERSFAFSQYLKAFMRDIFLDYYSARRENRVRNFALDYTDSSLQEAQKNFMAVDRGISKKSRDDLIGSFRYLKNHFRSIYDPLDRKGRALIRPTKDNLTGLDFPGIMKMDADLYLLRENEEEIRSELSSTNKRNLDSFLKNFDHFEKAREEVAEQVFGVADEKEQDTIFLYLQNKREKSSGRKFYAKYKLGIKEVSKSIRGGYNSLASNIRDSGALFLGQDKKPDYIFMQGTDEIPETYLIRKLDIFSVK